MLWWRLLLFFLILPLCYSYPTFITSNYTSSHSGGGSGTTPEPQPQPQPEPQPQPQPTPTPTPTPPSPQPQPTGPLIQVRTVIITNTNGSKMGGGSQKVRSITSNFQQAFLGSGTLKGFAGIVNFQDDARRYNITFDITVPTITKTNVIVKYTDNSVTRIIGPSVAVGIKLFLRVLVFNLLVCDGFDFMRLDIDTIGDSVYSTTVTTPFEIDPSTSLMTYIVRISADTAFDNYRFLTKATYTGPNTVNFSLNATFSAISKRASVVIVFVKNTDSITVFNDYLDLSRKTVTLNLQTKMYYFISLTSFRSKNDVTIGVSLSNQLFTITSSYSGSNYYLSFDYFVVTDITPNTTMPTPTPQPEPQPEPEPQPQPQPQPEPQPQPQPQPQVNPESQYQFNLTSVVSFSYFNSTFELVYQNVPDIGDIDISQINIQAESSIKIISVTISGNKVIVLCSYQTSIQGIPISVNLNWVKDDIAFLATTNFTLETQPPLKIFYNPSKGYIVGKIAEIIQYLYLSSFAVSLLCRKLIGIQMMSFIQLTFYSLIPLGPLNPMFSGLYKMPYVSGINIQFNNLPSQILPSSYSSLKINSNFLSNVNLMLTPLLLCPIMFGTLLLASHFNNSYKYKPRLKQYSLASICEWVFTIVLFSCYNIYVSLVVDIQSLGTTSPISLSIGLIISLAPLVVIILYAVFQKKYQEFNSQLNQSNKVFKLQIEKSKMICGMYPIILAIEIILIPLFLANQKILNYSLYPVFCITLLTSGYVFAVRPYDCKIDNIRLFIHRSLINLMVLVLILCQTQINLNTDPDSFITNLVWIILILLLIGFLINFPFIIWRLVVWVRARGVIDMKMYLKEKADTERKQAQIPTKFQNPDPVFYPILEYGNNQKLKQREKKKLNLSHTKKKKSHQEVQAFEQKVSHNISYQIVNQDPYY